MAWDRIQREWRVMRGSVKEQWGKLTDDDLDRISGKRDRLVGALQLCYAKTVSVVEGEVRDFERRILEFDDLRSKLAGDGETAQRLIASESESGSRGGGEGWSGTGGGEEWAAGRSSFDWTQTGDETNRG